MKVCKIILLISKLLFFSSSVFAQDYVESDEEEYEYEEMQHSVYFELLGHGILGSINYEHLFLRDLKFSPSVSVGASYFGPPFSLNPTPIVNLNTQLNYDFNEKHRIHFGPGVGAFFSSDDDDDETFLKEYLIVIIGAYVGYKRSIPDRNWYWGVTLSPFFQYKEWDMLPTGGLRVGYQFY